MGMDVNGIAPISEDGEYFRASVWSWPPILDLCIEAIKRFDLGIDTSGWLFARLEQVKATARRESADEARRGIREVLGIRS